MNLETLLEKRTMVAGWRTGAHLLFWIFFFGISVYLYAISFNPYRDLPLSYLEPLRRTLSLMIVYYPLVYVVGLRMWGQGRWSLGTAAALLLFLLYTVLDYAGEVQALRYCRDCDEAVAHHQPFYHHYLSSGFFPVVLSRMLSLGLFFQLLIYLTIPIAIKTGLGYHRYYVRSLRLARSNTQLELDFLKAQVNPHFLFNTLNNLYGLILHGRTEKSAETVARLADLMRYALYDSQEERVSLKKEISLIRNYIELERLRLNFTKVVFHCRTEGEGYSLPPLLLMPVVENAFKYNVDGSEGATITMWLEVREDVLHFTVENTFEPHRLIGRAGGLGLANFQKRLALCYPGKSTYQATIADTRYTAHTTLLL